MRSGVSDLRDTLESTDSDLLIYHLKTLRSRDIEVFAPGCAAA